MPRPWRKAIPPRERPRPRPPRSSAAARSARCRSANLTRCLRISRAKCWFRLGVTMELWPALPLAAWEPTRATLHMWTQIVGKVRLALSPHQNHWWQVPLYVSARGLTTWAMPYNGGVFEIEFDFVDHALVIRRGDGPARLLALAPKSVAAFHAELMAALRSLGIAVKIWTMPVEIPNPIAFDKDETHASYEPA